MVGIIVASQSFNINMMLIFAFAAFLMRSAGCAINDIIDRDIDPRVERTKNRPLASGTLTVQQAKWCVIGLLAIALGILLTFNKLTIILGFLIIIPITIYPWMKRITYWPQLFLGLTFNWGLLMGYAAVTGELHFDAYILYFACVAWTLGYDTIYAFQDKKDDIEIGMKSAAIAIENDPIHWLTNFYKASVFCFIIAAPFAGLSVFY